MENRQLLFLGMMGTPIAEVLGEFPQLAIFFAKSRVACSGCMLANFCSLRDVFRTYDLDRAAILEEVSEQIGPVGQIDGLN